MNHIKSMIMVSLGVLLAGQAWASGMNRPSPESLLEPAQTLRVDDESGSAYLYGVQAVPRPLDEIAKVPSVDIFRPIYRDAAGREAKLAGVKHADVDKQDQIFQKTKGWIMGADYIRIEEGAYTNYFRIKKIANYAPPQGVAVHGTDARPEMDILYHELQDDFFTHVGVLDDKVKRMVVAYQVYEGLPLNGLRTTDQHDMRIPLMYAASNLFPSGRFGLTSVKPSVSNLDPSEATALRQALAEQRRQISLVLEDLRYAKLFVAYNIRGIGIRLYDASAAKKLKATQIPELVIQGDAGVRAYMGPSFLGRRKELSNVELTKLSEDEKMAYVTAMCENISLNVTVVQTGSGDWVPTTSEQIKQAIAELHLASDVKDFEKRILSDVKVLDGRVVELDEDTLRKFSSAAAARLERLEQNLFEP